MNRPELLVAAVDLRRHRRAPEADRRQPAPGDALGRPGTTAGGGGAGCWRRTGGGGPAPASTEHRAVRPPARSGSASTRSGRRRRCCGWHEASIPRLRRPALRAPKTPVT
ncbi:uncharacterized protein LOC144944638 [Lampetra fluviatilis]